ncbi:hypothetical protein [Micromonospora narathiwatensis]|uniref:Helix-turn-helix domain-containing protein n=1 Tax=Micromonospora narathiwatensis TaxID=299146 RepID=A0A1A9AFQ4_9ACTN|nr:hypothetical protein [Micromonospora narathiwatensis]SBT55016.1 hypothetical protein GA0070621_5847 [Micromonospora narathiwatensis]
MLRLDQAAAAPNESDGTPAGPDTAIPANPMRPPSAGTPAELVTAMRVLKEWTGLTYRQLQRRAANTGAVLPHSTIAAVLSRTTLPREDLLATFVRACGGDDTTVEGWLTARRRIAVAATLPGPDNTGTPPQQTVPRQAAPEPGAVARAEGGQPPDPAAPPAAVPDRGSAASPARVGDGVAGQPDNPPPAAPEPGPPIAPQAATPPAPAARPVPDADSPRPVIARTDDAWETGLRSATEPDPSALASATAQQRQWRWRGIHRHDPADEVPRPEGLRWLVPPIMYRTGWAARVLSGVLVLLLALVAVAFVARLIRDRDDRPVPEPTPTGLVVETEEAGPPLPSNPPPTTKPKPSPTKAPAKDQPSASTPPASPPASPTPSPTYPAAGPETTHRDCDRNGCNPYRDTPRFTQPTPESTSNCQYPCVEITTYDP